jgi:hypothetical protein
MFPSHQKNYRDSQQRQPDANDAPLKRTQLLVSEQTRLRFPHRLGLPVRGIRRVRLGHVVEHVAQPRAVTPCVRFALSVPGVPVRVYLRYRRVLIQEVFVHRAALSRVKGTVPHGVTGVSALLLRGQRERAAVVKRVVSHNKLKLPQPASYSLVTRSVAVSRSFPLGAGVLQARCPARYVPAGCRRRRCHRHLGATGGGRVRERLVLADAE